MGCVRSVRACFGLTQRAWAFLNSVLATTDVQIWSSRSLPEHFVRVGASRGKGQERAVLAGGTGVGSADVGAPRRRRVRQPWMWIRTAVVCCLRGGYALPCVGSAG